LCYRNENLTANQLNHVGHNTKPKTVLFLLAVGLTVVASWKVTQIPFKQESVSIISGKLEVDNARQPSLIFINGRGRSASCLISECYYSEWRNDIGHQVAGGVAASNQLIELGVDGVTRFNAIDLKRMGIKKLFFLQFQLCYAGGFF